MKFGFHPFKSQLWCQRKNQNTQVWWGRYNVVLILTITKQYVFSLSKKRWNKFYIDHVNERMQAMRATHGSYSRNISEDQ